VLVTSVKATGCCTPGAFAISAGLLMLTGPPTSTVPVTGSGSGLITLTLSPDVWNGAYVGVVPSIASVPGRALDAWGVAVLKWI